MSVQNWPEDVILVELPPEPKVLEQLRETTQVVRDRGDCDVVVDFSQVDILTSDSLAQLVRLRKLLTDCQHQMTLCCVGPATQRIFSVTGLDEVFTMVEERSDALVTVKAPS